MCLNAFKHHMTCWLFRTNSANSYSITTLLQTVTHEGNARAALQNQRWGIKVLSVGSIVHSGMKNDTVTGYDGMASNLTQGLSSTLASPTQIQPRSLLEGIFWEGQSVGFFLKQQELNTWGARPPRPSALLVHVIAGQLQNACPEYSELYK